MFHFEDPVAVELIQNGSRLTGLGCDAGLPSSDVDAPSEEYCGPIVGEVTGNRARFEFVFGAGQIAVAVTVSADASRMTGGFALSSPTSWEMSWLPFSEGRWLQGRRDESPEDHWLDGKLQLVDASPGANEFEVGRTYRLWSRGDAGVSGDLGSFWYSEVVVAGPNDPVRVGPVPVTNPDRPISLDIERRGTAITRVTAVAGSGATYVFLPTL
jgi:hypothetical protein